MNAIEVIRPGSSVILGGEIAGHMSAVLIKEHGYQQYQVSWWDGNTRKVEWIEASELVATANTDRLKVGWR